MTKVKNFSENLESGLARLGHEIQANRERKDAEFPGEKEIVKKSLQAIANDTQSTISVSDASTQNDLPESDENVFMPGYLKNAQGHDEIKKAVERLIELAIEKGVEIAVSTARKTNPFIEDAFHDALADKLIPELKRRGIFD